jgi:chromosome segregation ATPase
VIPASVLSERVEELIGRYREMKAADAGLRAALSEKDKIVKDLQSKNTLLRKRIDELDRDRHRLKQLEDERKIMRRELEEALTRLETLEKEF